MIWRQRNWIKSLYEDFDGFSHMEWKSWVDRIRQKPLNVRVEAEGYEDNHYIREQYQLRQQDSSPSSRPS